MRRVMLFPLAVVLLAGCLTKPAPWQPDGLIGVDVVGEVDVRFVDGTSDVQADVPETGSDIDVVDVDVVQDSDAAILPDVEVVVPLGVGPVFSSVAFRGTSAGAGLTLRAMGPSGQSAGGVSAGGGWELRNAE